MRSLPKLVASMALLLSTSAGAAPDPGSAKQAPIKAGDPNERVCEDIVMTGSRIASKRVCMTRAQWAEHRTDDRDAIEKAQRSPNVGCSVINTHSSTPGC